MSAVTPTILSEGQAIDSTYGLASIDVVKAVNRIPYAQVMLIDGNVAQQSFDISNTADFEPGKLIEIKLRYEGEDDFTVFKGVVVKHSVSADVGSSLLTLDLKDAAVATTLVRKSAIFREMTDDAVINQLISDNGLEAGTVESTNAEHLELVQFHSTDWDFMLSRAEANGLVMAVNDGQISATKIDLSGSVPATHVFEYGISEIYNFEIEADAEQQLPSIESLAWDIAAQTPTDPPTEATDFTIEQGNLTATSLTEALGISDPGILSSLVSLTPEELQAWADGQLMRRRLSLIQGRIAIRGFGEIALLDLIEVSGVGDRFNGKTIVTGIRHRLDHHGWQTDIQFGLSATQFAERRDLTELPAAGLLPAVNGLQIGIVGAYEEDPAGELRVKVILPSIDHEAGFVWARLISPDAGIERGFFFRPEVDDEVVVGFLNDDPRQAVILGALYSSVNTPPEAMAELSEDNINKGIVTKKGTTIQFVDDENPSLVIQTAAENKVMLSDDEEIIAISDQHGNTITLSADGIEIVSAADLKIEASGNIEITGSEVDVK